jgi:hypothetical protein
VPTTTSSGVAARRRARPAWSALRTRPHLRRARRRRAIGRLERTTGSASVSVGVRARCRAVGCVLSATTRSIGLAVSAARAASRRSSRPAARRRA